MFVLPAPVMIKYKGRFFNRIQRDIIVKKVLILSLLFILPVHGAAMAQTATTDVVPVEQVDADPLQAEKSAYVDCLYKAVEAHKEKFNSYRYKRRAIKHACLDEGKELFKAKVKSSPEVTDFKAKRQIGNEYVQSVNKQAFAEISAHVKAKLAATEPPAQQAE